MSPSGGVGSGWCGPVAGAVRPRVGLTSTETVPSSSSLMSYALMPCHGLAVNGAEHTS